MRLFVFLLLLFTLNQVCISQDSLLQGRPPVAKPIPDSIRQSGQRLANDTVRNVKRDTLSGKKFKRPVKLPYAQLIRTNPFLNFSGVPRYEIYRNETKSDQDLLFYLMTAFVLVFALIRLIFWKYLDTLFAVLFRISIKQKQMRERLTQSPLPSLLLNLFFTISGGLYIGFLFRYYDINLPVEPWQVMPVCILGLVTIYLVKFLLLKLMGWIFNISEATDTYIFIVFLVNKLLGILLIPALLLMAFSGEPFVSIAVITTLVLIVVFFLYRYIASYEPVRREIKVSQVHFILYLFAFEVTPLLLIYKVLLTFLGKST